MKKLYFLFVVLLISFYTGTYALAGHFTPVNVTPNAMNINILEAKNLGINLVAGDEIGIFDGTLCVGVVVLEKPLGELMDGDMASVVAYGKEGTDPGFVAGHAITFKYWDASEQMECAAVNPHFWDPTQNPAVEISPLKFSTEYSAFVQLFGSCKIPPKAVDDNVTTDEDKSFSGNVGTNDVTYGMTVTWKLKTAPSHGTAIVNADGSFIYTPVACYNGPDQFSYELCEAEAGCSSANVNITVSPVNNFPKAIGDTFEAIPGVAKPGNVAANDTQSCDGGNAWSKVTDPANGILTFNNDGSFTYKPNDKFYGSDSFIYKLCDVDGDCSTATVSIAVPAIVTVSDPDLTDNVPVPPVFVDDCGVTLVPTGPVVTTKPVCQGDRTYTWTYTPCTGAPFTFVFTYKVVRNDFVITAQAGGSTVECPAATDVQPVPPVITDDAGDVLTPSAPAVSQKPACEGTRTYTFTFTDCVGNHHDWVYTYTVDRVTPPAVAPGGSPQISLTAQCLSQAVPPTNLPTVADVCGNTLPAPVPVVTDTPNPLTCGGTREYKYTYTDCAGLSTDVIVTYTIAHVTPPAEVGGPVATTAVVQDLSSATAPATLPVVKDVCGNVLTPSAPEVTTSGDCTGMKKYEYTYTDCAGLTFKWTFNYVVQRTVPPGQVGGPVPNSSTVDCMTKTMIPTVLPVVKDVAGVLLSPTPDSPVVATVGTSCQGTKTYTYKYVDCALLEYVWVYTFTVVDNLVPEFAVPADVTIQAGANCVYDARPEITGMVQVMDDNCNGQLVITKTDVESKGVVAGTVLLTRTWTVCDPCSNCTQKVQRITVIGGNYPPDLKLSPYCVYLTKYGKWTLNNSEIKVITAGTSAFCGKTSDISFDLSPRAFECKDALAPVPVLVTAKDGMGNTVTGTVLITVIDTIKPVAKCKDAVIYLDKFEQAYLGQELINDGNDRESTPDWAKHFNDLEGGSYDNCGISELKLSKQLFKKANIGLNEVTLTAVDPSGNTGTCKSWVTVNDTITPPVTVPPVVTSVTDIRKSMELKLWPNPTRGNVNIDLKWNFISEMQVKVYNVLGREIFDKTYIAGDKVSFDMSQQSSGIYIVEMNADGIVFRNKLILDKK